MRRAKPQRQPSARPGLSARLVLLRAAIAVGRRGMRKLLRRMRRQPTHLLRVLGRLRMRSHARRRNTTEDDIQ